MTNPFQGANLRSTNRRNLLKLAVWTTATVSVSGCPSPKDTLQGQHGNPSGEALDVVATTGMIADMVRSIGGNAVRLTQLIPAGVDPHLYKPIRDDIVAIVHAKIVFYNGLKLEGRMSDVLGTRPKSDRLHVALSDALTSDDLIGEPMSDQVDPHIWMDVSLWSKTVGLIEQSLAARLPTHQARFQQAAEKLREQLAQLDRYGQESIERIPKKQRVLISSHDAFQYFGRRYGLRVEGVQGISTASEAGLQRIPQLIEIVSENSVPAVFKESSVAGKMIDAVIEGAASRSIKLQVGQELYSDALGPAGSHADNYLGMMKHNFDAVSQALSGQP
jgi:manganese/zinc/iron transport system substrate-binding protein